MMKYILIVVALALVVIAGVAGYFYFTNPSTLYQQAPESYQSPVVIDDKEISENSNGGVEVDTMEAEINSLDVPTDSGDVSSEDLMGL